MSHADSGQPCLAVSTACKLPPQFRNVSTCNNFENSWSQHWKVHLCSQFLAGCNVRATRAVCFADVPSCLGGSNPPNSVGSFRPSVGLHPSQWCNLVAAACVYATQLLTNSSNWHEHTAVSTSQGDVFAESKLGHEQVTLRSNSLGDDFHRSEQRHAVYMLPVQLLRHMQTVKQNIDADTWQMVWCLYATEDVSPGESHLSNSRSLCYKPMADCLPVCEYMCTCAQVFLNSVCMFLGLASVVYL